VPTEEPAPTVPPVPLPTVSPVPEPTPTETAVAPEPTPTTPSAEPTPTASQPAPSPSPTSDTSDEPAGTPAWVWWLLGIVAVGGGVGAWLVVRARRRTV
jgi:hypothetical protein